MDIQFAKYKELIELQLEGLTAEDVLGQSAQKTVELDQQSVGRLSRMDALQSQAMAQVQQRRRDAHKQALQAALRRLAANMYGCACGYVAVCLQRPPWFAYGATQAGYGVELAVRGYRTAISIHASTSS